MGTEEDPIHPAFMKKALAAATLDELRAEVQRRGLEIHSKQFSQAAQEALRELERLRRRIDELITGLQPPPAGEASPSKPPIRRFAKPGEEV
jgi:hypothetical protein